MKLMMTNFFTTQSFFIRLHVTRKCFLYSIPVWYSLQGDFTLTSLIIIIIIIFSLSLSLYLSILSFEYCPKWTGWSVRRHLLRQQWEVTIEFI